MCNLKKDYSRQNPHSKASDPENDIAGLEIANWLEDISSLIITPSLQKMCLTVKRNMRRNHGRNYSKNKGRACEYELFTETRKKKKLKRGSGACKR
jgi:IS30 family transposase